LIYILKFANITEYEDDGDNTEAWSDGNSSTLTFSGLKFAELEGWCSSRWVSETQNATF